MHEPTVNDDQLLEILKECKNLPNFLNSVFGFLKRRTDFYFIASEPSSPIGLPEGVAEQLVKEIFYKWKLIDKARETESEEYIVPSAITEVTIDGTETCDVTDADTGNTSTEIDFQSNAMIQQSAAKFSSSDSYNGAVYENYTWSQTITDIDIIVKLPQNITSKDITIKILPQKITVKLNDGTILLDGDLCDKVKHHDALWSLDKQNLEVHLDKTTEFWWDCLVTHEPKIKINEIDCSRPYEDLSAEAQAKIEELSWNQERKRLGLPTSDEIMLQNKLKKAWNVEGSPFKGTFDPNTVVFDH